MRNNVYDVTVQVSDGTNTDTQAMAVHGDECERQTPVITIERRRCDGGGLGCREQHGGDDGDGDRRGWSAQCADLLACGRSGRGEVRDQ